MTPEQAVALEARQRTDSAITDEFLAILRKRQDALAADVAAVRLAVRELVTRLAWASLDREDSEIVLRALGAPAPDPATVLDNTAKPLDVRELEVARCKMVAQIDPATGAVMRLPDCPKCGNNRQVWRNQITGRLRCHRVGCEADLPTPPPPALPGPVADAVRWMRSMAAMFPNVDGTPPPEAAALAAWARALPPALDEPTP